MYVTMDHFLFVLSVTSFCLSFFTRLPQIIRIYRGKSTAGMSGTSLLLEVWNQSCSVSYSYLFNLPCIEYATNLLQTYIIVALYLRYNGERSPLRFISILIIFVILHSLVMLHVTSTSIAVLFMYSSLPLAPLARILQIIYVFQCGSSQSLSSLTYTLQSVCAICRLIRLSLISRDLAMIFKLSSMSLCNGALALVIVKFSGEKESKKPSKKKKHIN